MKGRREAMLREMGLAPLWRLRSRKADQETRSADGSGSGSGSGSSERETNPAPPAASTSSRSETPIAEPATNLRMPPASGISGSENERVVRISGLDWESLESEIRSCTACRLCEQRKQAVPGVGDRRADWMVVGEGPGAEEDRRGEPFVGQAGKLLDAMLAAIGLARGEGVYIANAVKCRPPLNRTPAADEIATCLPFLERQIQLVQPRILIALGRPAAETLLGTEVRINAARGKSFAWGQIPVVVTYHPAYLLRNPADKGKAWEDLCRARRMMST